MINKNSSAARSQLLLLLATTYVAQGIGQHFGLVAQPLEYFLLRQQNLNAAQVAAFLSLLMFPYTIKPLYGLISDALPLLGFHKKSYISLAYGLSAAAFVLVACGAGKLSDNLLLTAFGMAISTALLSGLLVQQSQSPTDSRKMWSWQASFYYGATTMSALIGGWLCTVSPASEALRSAAVIVGCSLSVVSIASYILIKEKPSAQTSTAMKAALFAIKSCLSHKPLYAVALMIWCLNFSPSLGASLYFHYTNTLHFSQLFIGQLGAITSAGMLTGAVFFRQVIATRFSIRNQVLISIVLGAASSLSYLLLTNHISALLIEFTRGVLSIIGILTIYGLAADASPRRAESTVMALMISINNLSMQASTFLGGTLYVHWFHADLQPLIIVSAGCTLLCLLLVPLLSVLPNDIYDDHATTTDSKGSIHPERVAS